MTDGQDKDKEWERMKPRANKIRLMVTRGEKKIEGKWEAHYCSWWNQIIMKSSFKRFKMDNPPSSDDNDRIQWNQEAFNLTSRPDVSVTDRVRVMSRLLQPGGNGQRSASRFTWVSVCPYVCNSWILRQHLWQRERDRGRWARCGVAIMLAQLFADYSVFVHAVIRDNSVLDTEPERQEQYAVFPFITTSST